MFALRPAALLAPSLLLLGVVSGCGGSTPPTASPSGSTESSGPEASDSVPHTSDTKPKAAIASKYPEPFLEADCASSPPEGYFPNGKSIVAEARRQHWDELVACGHAVEGQVSGEIRTSFRLDPDGVPRCVEAPGMPQTEVVRCVLSVYRSFRFPPPKNGSVRITDGIRLDSSEEDEE